MEDLTAHQLREAEEARLQVLNEVLRAHAFGWELIEVVENARDVGEARDVLMDPPFSFDASAAEHVLNRTLGGRTRASIEGIERERDRIIAHLAE